MKKLLALVFMVVIISNSLILAKNDSKSGKSAENLNLGPAEIDLTKTLSVPNRVQKPVIFPHRFLQEALEYQCDLCHMSKEGGLPLKNQNTGKELTLTTITGVANPMHNEFCWPCHTKLNVPQGRVCSKCHK